ncbi:MAG: IclR family transcriptional regulator [Actinomycetota bacterium]|nr:IclR family transcriptional regulator [Actinomycetota bacterium]
MRSLDKVFTIIETLKVHKEARLYEIAQWSGLNKSTAYRILSKLQKKDYVQVNPDSKKYSLGLKFIEIANTQMENFSLIKASKEVIDDLNNRTKETIHLVMVLGEKAIYIDKRESQNPVRMYSRIGLEVPFYCTAVGKAILAAMPEHQREEIMDSIEFIVYTQKTITNQEQLRQEIKVIQKKGFALDNQEMQDNIICIAAAIKDYRSMVVGALSLTLTLYSPNIGDPQSYARLVMDSARKISRNLGHVDKSQGLT